MDYAKLLFAAEVRRLAVDLRVKTASAYLDTIQNSGDEYKVERQKWLVENPVKAFVPEAIAEINAVVEIIESLG